MNPGMYSSKKKDWETPQWLFDELNAEFGFTMDVCATAQNAKCTKFYTPEDDGLSKRWTGVCWMNPPYGREIKRWVQKAWTESVFGITVVCLLPARTDTVMWHDLVIAHASEIRFIRGRLRFEGGKNSAPFPSAIVIFQGDSHDRDTA